jgi:hypothetical protein
MIKSINNGSKDYLEQIRDLIKDYDSYEIIGEDYYEWTVDDITKPSEKLSPEFTLCGKKWQIKLDESSSKFRISLNLLNSNENLFTRILFTFKNDSSYSSKTSPFYHFSIYNKFKYCDIYNREELYKDVIVPLTKGFRDNNITIGIYIRFYKYDLFEYICELKDIINDDNKEMIKEDYFECPIKNWRKAGSLYISPEIDINNTKWRVKFFINKIKSALVFDIESLSFHINDFGYVYANYVASLHKMREYSYYYAKEFTTLQRNNENNKEFSFDNPSDFENISYLIENGSITVGIYICIYRNNFKGPTISKEGKKKLSGPFTKYEQVYSKFNNQNSEIKTNTITSLSNSDILASRSSEYVSSDKFTTTENVNSIPYMDISPLRHSVSVPNKKLTTTEGNDTSFNKNFTIPKRSTSLSKGKFYTTEMNKDEDVEKSNVLSTPKRSTSIPNNRKRSTSVPNRKNSHFQWKNTLSSDNYMNSFSDSYSNLSSISQKIFEGEIFIALSDYKGNEPNELTFNKGDQLIVCNWNGTNDFAVGCSFNNLQKQGLILKSIITKYNNVTATSLPSPPASNSPTDTDSYLNDKFQYDQNNELNSLS